MLIIMIIIIIIFIIVIVVFVIIIIIIIVVVVVIINSKKLIMCLNILTQPETCNRVIAQAKRTSWAYSSEHCRKRVSDPKGSRTIHSFIIINHI